MSQIPEEQDAFGKALLERLRYGEIPSPWWHQLNFAIPDISRLVDGTGWRVHEQHIRGEDLYVRLGK